MDNLESQQTIKTEPMILKVTSSLPMSCFYAFETGSSMQYFQRILPKEKFQELKNVEKNLGEHIKSPEDYARLIKCVYTSEHSSIEQLANEVGTTFNDQDYSKKLEAVVRSIEPIISEQIKSNPLFVSDNYVKAVQQHPEFEKSQILLSQFRNFFGEHAHYIGDEITTVIGWQPPTENGSSMVSSRAYPNAGVMIIGIPSNTTVEDISLGGVFHESIHMIFQEESPMTKKAMEKAGFFDDCKDIEEKEKVSRDMGEAIAHLFHYDFYEEEVKNNEGRINKVLMAGNRSPTVLKQLKYAKKLKPLIKEYMDKSKSMDESFFKSACKIYKELSEKGEL